MIGLKITSSEGKVFRRMSDGMLFGNEIYLGMAYPTNEEPYEELPEHFEEICDPKETEIIVLNEATPLANNDTPETIVLSEEQEEAVETSAKHAVTVADYRELEKKVELLMKLIGGN